MPGAGSSNKNVSPSRDDTRYACKHETGIIKTTGETTLKITQKVKKINLNNLVDISVDPLPKIQYDFVSRIAAELSGIRVRCTMTGTPKKFGAVEE